MIHHLMPGLSETDLRHMICSLVPSWRGDVLEDFTFLSGGYSNANVVFTRRQADQSQRYVLRIPQRTQPYVNRLTESAWYQRLPSSVGIRPVVLDIPTGRMISPWVEGDLLIDVFADRFSERDLLVYLQTLHSALPAVTERYSVPALLSAFAESSAQSGAGGGCSTPWSHPRTATGGNRHLPQRPESLEYSGNPERLGDLGLGICRPKRWYV